MDSSNGTTKARVDQGEHAKSVAHAINQASHEASLRIANAFVGKKRPVSDPTIGPSQSLIFRLKSALIAAAKATLGDDQPQDEFGVGIPVVARGPAGLNLPSIRTHEDYAAALAQQAIMAGHWMKEAKSWEAEASEADDRAHKARQDHRIDLGDVAVLISQVPTPWRYTGTGNTKADLEHTFTNLIKAAQTAAAGTAEDPIADVRRDMADLQSTAIGRDDETVRMSARAFSRLQQSIARLSAGKVQKPATLHTRSPAASSNELHTAIAGATPTPTDPGVITDAEGQKWTNGQAPEPQP